MRGAIPPLPQYVFMAWCLVKHRDNIFYLLYGMWQAQRREDAHGGVEVELHALLTSALDGSQCSALRPGRFTPDVRAPGTH
jgi:hypothetical protein